MDDNRYWSVGNVVALVCFVSVALAPWLVVLARWPEIGPWELLGLATIWAVMLMGENYPIFNGQYSIFNVQKRAVHLMIGY